MEFRFNVNDVFKQPIVEVGHTLIPTGFKGDRRALWDTLSKVTDVINAMGSASATAQSLSKPITSADRLRNCDQQTLYLLIDQKACNGKGAVTGMLKTGKKGLYVFDRDGHYYQVQSPCILDFYVHESRQRSGLGKHLFEHMLQKEAINPEQLAIDRPSDKFLGFLTKHYQLSNPIRQMNNYVVYDGFFPQVKKEEQVAVGSGDTSKNAANGLQAQIVTSPYGRYGAPRPPCSMGQIIHNQSSAVTPQEPTGTLQEQVHQDHQVPQVPQVQWQTMQPNNQQDVCSQKEIVQYENNTVSAPVFSAPPDQKAGNGLEPFEGFNIKNTEVSNNLQNNSQLHWPFNGAQAYPEMPRSKVTYPPVYLGDLLQPEKFKETNVVPLKSTYDLSGRPIDSNSIVSKGNNQFWVQTPSGQDQYNYFAKSIKTGTKDQPQFNNNNNVEQNQGYNIEQGYNDPNSNQQQVVYYQVPSDHYIPQNNVQYVPMQQQQQNNQQLFATELQHPNVVYYQNMPQETYGASYIPQESNQNISYMKNVKSDQNILQYHQLPSNNEQITYQQYYNSPQQIVESKLEPIIQNNSGQNVPSQIVLNPKTGKYHYLTPTEQNHTQQNQEQAADVQNMLGAQQSYNYQEVPNEAPVQQMQNQMHPIPSKAEQICSTPQYVNQQHQAQNQTIAQNISSEMQIQPQNTTKNVQSVMAQSPAKQTTPNSQVYSTQQTPVQPQVQQGYGQPQQTYSIQSMTCKPEQTTPGHQAYLTQQPQQVYSVQQNLQAQEQPQQAYLQPNPQVYSTQQTLVQPHLQQSQGQSQPVQSTTFTPEHTKPQQVYSVQQKIQPQECQGGPQQAYLQSNPQVYSTQQTSVQPHLQQGQGQSQHIYPVQSTTSTPEYTTAGPQAYSTQQNLGQPQQIYSAQQAPQAYSIQHNLPEQSQQQTHHIIAQQPSKNQYATPSISQKTISIEEQNMRVPQIIPIQQNYSVPQSYKQIQVPTNYPPRQIPKNHEESNVLPANYGAYQQPQYVQYPQYIQQMPTMDGAGDKRELESDKYLNKSYIEPLLPIENLPKQFGSLPKVECPNLSRSLSKPSDMVAVRRRQSSRVHESHQKAGNKSTQLQSTKSLPQNSSQPLFVTKNRIVCKACIPRS